VDDGGPPAVNRARFSNAATAALLVATAWLAAPPLAARESVPRFDTVILDAGHGGEDPGARGGRKLEEKDLVLTLTEQLAARLRGAGFHVVLTRASDVFVSLEERFSIANDARGDLFVSIHANASEDPEAHGSEVYFYGDEASDASARSVAARENLAFRDSGLGGGMTADPVLAILGDLKRGAYQVESARFAGHAEKQLARVGSRRSRGVKQAPFVVLNGQMPAALVEVGFITHRGEERKMRSKTGQEQIVSALAKAVVDYGRNFDKKWEAR